MLEAGPPTVPLLVACGEAHARAAQPVEAFDLYQRAARRSTDRAGLASRAAALSSAAAEELLSDAERSAAAGRREEASARVLRALSIATNSPRALVRAAEVNCALGEKERALEDYRRALSAGEVPAEDRERAGELALETGDEALAVSVFDRLASEDPRFAARAAEARLAFRIANWPDPERQAARARRVTRAAAASLTWWMCPEIREAKVRAGIVASDVLERKDSRAVMRAISLGLLEVDADSHRARPDAPLTRAAAARWLVRLSEVLAPSRTPLCMHGVEAPRRSSDFLAAAERCGFLAASGTAYVGGPEFTRALDRVRAVVAPEES
jgi:tetratricopeptide (TPR) repeat protein